MSILTSDPHMSDRERVCAVKWLEAAIDKDDPDLADYWKEQGIAARQERLLDGGEPIAEPPIPEYKPKHPRPKPACDLCGDTACVESRCLL